MPDAEHEVHEVMALEEVIPTTTGGFEITTVAVRNTLEQPMTMMQRRVTRKQTARLCITEFKLETAFYHVGRFEGKNPYTMVFISLLLCATMGMGMMLWREELSDMELFMPPHSPVRDDAAWVEQHFRDDMRYESIIVTADNVLTPQVLKAIAELDRDIRNITIDKELGWGEVCARYLTWFESDGFSILEDEELRELFEERPDFSLRFNNDCIFQTILRLWPDDHDFENMTQAAILKIFQAALNGSTDSDFTIFQDVRPLLSGVEYNEKGELIGAKSTLLNYMLTETNNGSELWELEFIKQVLGNRSLPAGMKIFAVADRSYNDALHSVLESNMTTLFSGFALIIFYVILMMGRFNRVEHRIYVSLLGVSIVGMSIAASYGISFLTGYFYGPIHPILPFLLLGIGVDDMFVICQALDNLSPSEKQLPVEERIGLTLKSAGPSITVTSLTDIVAFAVGTSTVMPSLKSFCFFAASGIVFLYVFVISFFVSCVAVDEYRVKSKRDGCFFMKLNNWKPNAWSQRDFQKLFFGKVYGPFLMKPVVKGIVIVITVLLFGFNLWCCFQVEQKFDPILYLNPDSYPLQFANALKENFPKHGKRAGIYIGNIDYFEEKENLDLLVEQLQKNPYINKETVNFWFHDFQKWLVVNNHVPESSDEFHGYLSEYLFFTKEGMAFMKDIKFSGFPFGDYKITASQIPIQHILLNTTAEQVQAMQSVRDLLASINFTTGNSHMVAFSSEYISWTANKVIAEELMRNLALTIGAVAIVTIMLIRNIRASLCVIACVCSTLVGLIGSMYLFGLTIEISTSIVIILCVGLAVDYSAHIGHKFTALEGSRNDRAKDTLIFVGPPVLNGGISTFLAFVMLSNSDSYIFTTFFKLFLSVVVYGLFHGECFLPVILSLVGPQSAKNRDSWHERLYTVASENHNGGVPLENNGIVGEGVELSMIPPTHNHGTCPNLKQDNISKVSIERHCEVNEPVENGCSMIENHLEPDQEMTLLQTNVSLTQET